jgi:hypothetical protein
MRIVRVAHFSFITQVETVVYCQSRLRYCYKATVRRSNKQGRSTATVLRKLVQVAQEGVVISRGTKSMKSPEMSTIYPANFRLLIIAFQHSLQFNYVVPPSVRVSD